MKKIVFIVETMDKGVGKHVMDLYSNLKNDFDITIIYGSQRTSEEYKKLLLQEENIEVDCLKEKIGISDIKAIFKIRKILKEIKPDIVHCHSSKAGLSGRIAAKLANVKMIIYSPHAYFFLKQEKKSIKWQIFLMAEKFLSKFFTDKTITTSRGEDQVFVDYKIDKLSKRQLIVHGLDVPKINENTSKEIREKYNVNDNQILVGSMARFEKQKDPITTVKILEKLCKNNANVKCIFWGNGSLYDEVKNLNSHSETPIILAGETSEPDDCLNALDIYLTASLYEGLPYTLLEALALKLPIIATNVVGNNDCVKNGVNGYLFEVNNCDEAVTKIEQMIENNLLEQMSEESFKIYQDLFSTQKMIDKYKKIYIGEKHE